MNIFRGGGKLLGLSGLLLALGCPQRAAIGGVDAGVQAAPTAKAEVAAPKVPKVVTITTPSEEAREEFLKARKLVEDNRESEALAGFRRAVKLDPDFPLALAYLGFHGSGGEGVAELDRATVLGETLPEAEHLYIQLLWAYRHGNVQQAAKTVRQLLQVAPDEWRASFELGQQAYEERNFSLAIAAYRRSMELADLTHTCVGYNNLGYAQAMGEHYDLALLALKRCTDRQPDEPNSHDSVGEVALAAGQLDRAQASFERALSNDPRFFVAWQGVAAVRFFRGDHAGATEALAKARESGILPADHAAVDIQAAWLQLAAHGTSQAALAQLERMENEARSLKSAGLYDLGDAAIHRSAILLEAGQPEQALLHAQAAVRQAGSKQLPGALSGSLLRRALTRQLLALVRLKKLPEAQAALGLLEEQGKAQPDHPEVRSGLAFGRGMLAHARGDLATADRELSSCKLFGLSEWTHDHINKPEDSLCLWNRALVQKQRGDQEGWAQTVRQLKGKYTRDPVALYVWSLANAAQAGEGRAKGPTP